MTIEKPVCALYAVTQGHLIIEARAVRAKIEPRMLLVELLRDQDIDIARRTVAKYREQLGILSSSKRRQVF